MGISPLQICEQDYGFPIFNTATNTVVVPFSANNRPSFDIATNGSYRVDVSSIKIVLGTQFLICQFSKCWELEF